MLCVYLEIELSIKDKEKNKQKEIIEISKKSDLYKSVLDFFPDAELTDIKSKQKNDE